MTPTSGALWEKQKGFMVDFKSKLLWDQVMEWKEIREALSCTESLFQVKIVKCLWAPSKSKHAYAFLKRKIVSKHLKLFLNSTTTKAHMGHWKDQNA